MVKRVRITYKGNVEKVIQYNAIIKETDTEIVYRDVVGTHVKVIKANVLQIREL